MSYKSGYLIGLFCFLFSIPAFSLDLCSNTEVSFTEEMKGYLSTDKQFKANSSDMEADSAYEAAAVRGRNLADRTGKFQFKLTIISDPSQTNSKQGVSGSIIGKGLDASDNLDSFVIAPQLTGGVDKKLRVVDGGKFYLFDDDGITAKGQSLKKMRYFMKFCDDDAKECWVMHAFKQAKQDKAYLSFLEVWQDTSTLYITIFKNRLTNSGKEVNIEDVDRNYLQNSNVEVVGKGVLRIEPLDFAKQMTTLKGHSINPCSSLKSIMTFGGFFAKSLFTSTFKSTILKRIAATLDFLGKDRTSELPKIEPRVASYNLKGNSAPTSVSNDTYDIALKNNVHIKLTRYQGKNSANKDPLLLIPGLGVNSKIFTQTWTNRNLVEYLSDHEVDVWVLDYRTSIDFATAKDGKSTGEDIAQEDILEAMLKIKEITNRSGIHVLGHCYGSHAFLMGMLSGVYKRNQIEIKSYVASQATLFLDVPSAKMAQVDMLGQAIDTAAEMSDQTGVSYFSAKSPGTDYPRAIESIFSNFVRTYNFMSAKEGDHSQDSRTKKYSLDVHERIIFIYGPLYELSEINDGMLYYGMEEAFGPVGMNHLNHLQTMIKGSDLAPLKAELKTWYEAGRVSNFKLKSLSDSELQGHVMGLNGKRYLTLANVMTNLNLPITIIHGSENQTWLPSGSEKTLELLKTVNPQQRYKLSMIPGYGHLDSIFGKNASLPGQSYDKIKQHFVEQGLIQVGMKNPHPVSADERVSKFTSNGNPAPKGVGVKSSGDDF